MTNVMSGPALIALIALPIILVVIAVTLIRWGIFEWKILRKRRQGRQRSSGLGDTASLLVKSKSSLSGSIPPSAFLLGLGAGLFLPDVDLLALPILHHRSIITHSILIPFLLSLTAKNRMSVMTIAGIYGGVAIHLAADALSSPVGFGMVWLPWPIKTALGPLSPVWLVTNAAVSVWLMLRLTPGYKIWVLLAVVAVAAAYALLNEFAFAPFVAFGIILFTVVWLRRRKNTAKKYN